MMRAVVLLVVVATTAAHADTLDDVRKRGELRWGGDIQGGEPYAFEDPADHSHVIGFEVDIIDALARRLGVTARFHHCSWSNLVPSLERDDFDIIANGLEDTPAHRDMLLLSRPYFVYAETLAVRRGSAYRSLDDLAGKRIGTVNQTYAQELLRARSFDPVLYEGGDEPYLDLAAGRVDAVLLDNVVADRFGCGKSEIECLPDDVARGTYVIGLRRGDHALQAALDSALAEITANGELQRILDKWHLWDHRQREPLPVAVVASADRGELDGAQLVLFLEGAGVTLGLSVVSFIVATLLGVVLAILRRRGRAGGVFATAYVELFRGTPLLLQLYLIYYSLASIWKFDAISAAIIGLGLNYAAYECEVYRAALASLPRGQSEAAHALGLSGWHTLRHILLPQALRTALPAMTNDFVALLKDSSVVSVITVVELTKRTSITAVDMRGWLLPGLLCAALYLAISFPLTRLSGLLEKRLQRDSDPRPA
jgi:polar amino acid transport system substrate-binding protein